jgi:hypothetical protein
MPWRLAAQSVGKLLLLHGPSRGSCVCIAKAEDVVVYDFLRHQDKGVQAGRHVHRHFRYDAGPQPLKG